MDDDWSILLDQPHLDETISIVSDYFISYVTIIEDKD